MSRLLWYMAREHWGPHARLLTLLDDKRQPKSLDSSLAARLNFGARMAATQIIWACDWILYTHLAVAKVQAFIPGRLRRPYAVFIHGIEAWRPLRAGETAVLKDAALRVANSSFTARRVASLHPEIGPIEVCPLSLEPARTSTAGSHDMTWDAGPHAVISVARMASGERYKGHDELLEAWPAVLERVNDARLIFVGDGNDVPRLKAKARALGVAQAVIFTGFIPDAALLQLYGKAAVFAMPSRGEGFGLVYLEAMSQRLPCIGSLDDAATEIIEDGQTGFLIAQSDRQALTARIVRLLGDEALRARMGAAGLARVAERFSYDQFARTMGSLLQSTLSAPAGVSEGRVAV